MQKIEEIHAGYKRYLDRPPRQHELRDCMNSVSKDNLSVPDFITGTNEYRERVRKAIQQSFAELIGRRVEGVDVDAFGGRFPNMPVSEAMARQYVMDSDEFRDHYRAVIQQYLDLKDIELPESCREGFLKRFAVVRGYSVDRFLQDLEDGNLPNAPYQNPGIIMCGDECGSGHVSEEDGEEARERPAGRKLVERLDYLRKWEESTGKEMTTYEYVRFGDEIEAGDGEGMRRVSTKLGKMFEFAVRIYCDYLDRPYALLEFERAWIGQFDSPNFDLEFLADVLAGEGYEAAMTQKIRSVNAKLFKADIHPEDVQYCFDKCRVEQLSLGSERIAEIVVDCIAELSEITEKITAIYGEVLRREADEEEIRDAVGAFRFEEGAPATLAVDLYQSLEYRDIVKTSVAERYRSIHGIHMRPKALYGVLDGIFEEHGGDMRNWRMPADLAE